MKANGEPLEKDSSGAYLLRQGDSLGVEEDPNLSGPPFEVTTEGDGDDSTFVELTGFGNADPTVAKAKKGSLIRGKYDNYPPPNSGAEPYDDETKARKRSYVSVVESTGEKMDLGSWPEA